MNANMILTTLSTVALLFAIWCAWIAARSAAQSHEHEQGSNRLYQELLTLRQRVFAAEASIEQLQSQHTRLRGRVYSSGLHRMGPDPEQLRPANAAVTPDLDDEIAAQLALQAAPPGRPGVGK
jgi:biopolymer transport protein ExbB/TolQ